MSQSSRAELMTLALGVLPALPATVDVLSEGGGCHVLRLSHSEGDVLHGFCTRSAMRTGLHLLARVFDEQRGRYEIEFEVEESFFHTGSESLVHLTVTNVRHRKARRASPRVGVSVKLDARVRYCRTMPRDAQVEVRLIDVSATGLAFVTQRELSAGDMFQLSFPLAGELMEIETRVVRLDPAPYGRYRAGCEITEISDAHRRAISRLAEGAEEAGSAAERRPEHTEALSEARQNRAFG
jgi:hypothetical protein